MGIVENKPSFTARITMALLLTTLVSMILTGSNIANIASADAATNSNSTGKIVFASTTDGDFEIYVMDSDGSDRQTLTSNEGYDSFPSWSPDGKKIAFSAIRYEEGVGNKEEIYTMNADGTDEDKLGNDGVGGFWPKWSPDGAKIAFLTIRNGERDLYVGNVDGTGQARLTNDPADAFSPSWSPDGKKIAFARSGEIYVMDADDGSNVVNLTDNGFTDYEPSWSPKGDKIVFVSVRSGDADIFIMDADGTDQVNLLDNAGSERFPAFQPMPDLPSDGKIVFAGFRGQGNSEIYVINADGTNETKISEDLSTSDSYPSWSPDGTRILFESKSEGSSDIYVMDADGGNVEKVLQSALYDAHPSWSFDGSKIVYATDIDGKNKDLYIIDADGSGQKLLTDKAGDDSYPRFSPDGNKVVFSHYDYDNYEIHVIDVEVRNQTNLTNSPGDDNSPSWSPDGSKIVFASNRDGNSEIYVMDPDGTDLKRLTNSSSSDTFPRWSVVGTKIVFSSDRNDEYAEIYTMDADGTDLERLTRNARVDTEPSFGPLVHTPDQPTVVPPPNTCSVELTAPSLKSVHSTTLAGATDGMQFIITTTAKNCLSVDQPFVAFIEVRGPDDVTEHLDWQSGILKANELVEIRISWIPDHGDNYELRTFVVSDLSKPHILADVITSDVDIAESTQAIVLIPEGSSLESSQHNNFEPAEITVVIGVNNTVRWINADSVPSKVISDDRTDPEFFEATHAGPDADIFLLPGDVLEFTFTKPGSYGYHSEPHPWKHGTVIVLSPGT